MPNHLAQSNSPYLLQHADNPVEWYPWGEAGLEKARREDKPIFLSIGYAACHWCHVMAHESFEDPATAAMMNEICVNIKVDREERPDLDSIYMNAVVALTGQGGWPMSVFLTPEGVPFFGGTYFPPQPRYGKPSFKDVLAAVGRAWRNDRPRLLESGKELLQHIQSSYQSIPLNRSTDREFTGRFLEQAVERLAQSYDWEFGGWGKAPKFPQPMTIEFLLQRASRGDANALSIARHALDAMARGGMYDVVGGGFARYSTDHFWLAPHFEKMLYDNAQLARVYLHAYLLTQEPHYRQVCTQTLDFIQRELSQPGTAEGWAPGGFFSSLDADSEGEEGKYYLWLPGEIETILSNIPDSQPLDLDLFRQAFGVAEQGNFEGKIILQRKSGAPALAEKFAMAESAVEARLDGLLQALARARAGRVRPATDDKVLTAWNALALIAFAEAARYLKRPDYLEIARTTANFLLAEQSDHGNLYRSWRKGKAQHAGYLEDYAGLVLGLLALYQSDPDPRWYSQAEALAERMQNHFQDSQGGFFDTPAEQTQLIVRPKDIQDNATPSGNALAAAALLQLSHFSGGWEWGEQAAGLAASILPTASRYPTAFACWLSAADFASAPVQEVAILGDPALPETQALVEQLWTAYRPGRVVAISGFPPPPHAPALLHNRPLRNGLPTAYVCQDFTCRLPVNTVEDLRQQLD